MDKGIRFSLLLLVSCWSMAQTQVSLTADTLEVRLAEQINLDLVVSTDKQASIQFPPLKAFAPFEVIDSTAVDTTVVANTVTYSKTYAVIQFDSGQFTLPQQLVVVDGEVFKTDSLLVRVKDVAVDTLDQPLFPIKTILPMAKNTTGWWKPYSYGFLILIALVLLYFFIVKTQKRIRAKREKMPPFERALQALQALESKQLDKQEAYKDYYSEMTDIVRNYLEDETNIDALESTSEELLTKLELLRDTGNLELTNATIDQLKEVLSTADLVKFARALPEEYLARLDREKIELVVKDTKAALPEPTEEERLQNEAYARMRRKQQQLQRFKIAGFSFFGSIGHCRGNYDLQLRRRPSQGSRVWTSNVKVAAARMGFEYLRHFCDDTKISRCLKQKNHPKPPKPAICIGFFGGCIYDSAAHGAFNSRRGTNHRLAAKSRQGDWHF